MTTGTAGTVAREFHTQQVHYLRQNIVYTDGNTKTYTVGIIPAGSLILKPLSGVFVDTAYNSGTNKQLDVGITSGGNELADNLSLASTAFVALSASTGAFRVAVDTTIYATHDLTGTAASAGSGVVVIAFIPDNDKRNATS